MGMKKIHRLSNLGLNILIFLGMHVNLSAAMVWIDAGAKGLGDGSESAPFSTLETALKNTGGGNTFIFKSGNYPNPNLVIDRKYSGTQLSPTIIMSQYKYQAVLHGSITHNIHIKEGCKWVVINGFEISGAKKAGILIHGAYITVSNCYIHNNEVEGIGAHTPYNIVIENNLIEYNGRHPQFDHGIYVGGHNYLMRNNIIRFNAGWGIHCYPEISNSLIENNLVYRNNRGGIILVSKPMVGSNKIVNNTVARNGDGISVGNAYNDTIVNNIVTNNFIFTPGKSQTIHGWPDSQRENFKKKSENVIVDYNLCYPSCDVAGAHGFSANPLFLDEMKGAYFLKSGSPAIGKGLRKYTSSNDFFNNPRPDSLNIDIGCFPYKYTEMYEKMRIKLYCDWPYFGRGNTYFNKQPDIWSLTK